MPRVGRSCAYFVAVAVVAVFLVAGGGSSQGSQSGKPEYVEDLSTGQLYYVSSDTSGTIFLPERDNAVIRPGVYSGRYIDDYGNEYIAR